MNALFKFLLGLSLTASVIACQKSGSYSSFVSGSFSGISSVVLNSDGSVTINWPPASNVAAATYLVYQFDLGTSDSTAGTSASLTSSEASMALADVTKKLLATTTESPYTVQDNIVAGHKYAYLVRVNSSDIDDSNQVMQAVVASKTLGTSTTATPTASPISDSLINSLMEKISSLQGTLQNQRQIKIIAAGSGAAASIGSVSVPFGTTITLRAALYDMNNNYIQDQAVIWSMNNTAFASSDMSVASGVTSTTMTFSPSALGATVFQATYSGSDTSVTKATAVTGSITVSTAQTPTTLSIYSGNNQSATVGTNLPQPLIAKLKDASGLPIANANVTFSVFSGGGTLISTAVQTTDSTGLASAIVSLGTIVGTNTYKVTANSAPTVTTSFLATGLADVPATVSYATQPACTDYSQSFSTQPIVKILDQYGNTTTVSGSVTLSVQTGTGTITAGGTVSAVSGVATFIGLTYSKAETGVVLRATYTSSSIYADSTAFATQVGSKKIKILSGASGNTAVLAAQNLTVYTSLTMHAALFDLSDNYIADTANAIWSWTGGTFATGDGSVTVGTQSLAFAITPSSLATAVFTATYAGSDTTVTNTTYTTAAITSVSNGVASSMSVIAGDAQTGIAGNNLSTQLKVRVLDAFSQPVQAANVTFSVLSGGGSIVTAMPAVTDASGYALATVQLGATVASNSFKAAVTGNTGINQTFSATGIPGAVTQLIWTQAPATCFTNAPCGTQPIVTAKDANNNITTNAAGTVTLSVASGCTSVSGTNTATLNSGVATFSTVGCSGSGASVLTATLTGGVTGNSASFTVSAAPPGACQANDSAFTTAGGGCQDILSGLTWSAISTSTMTWYQMVWDSKGSVNAGTQKSPGDFGRTNDYADAVGSNTAATDTSTTNYCHSLTDGGQSDWRPPSLSELNTVYGHGSATHLNGANVASKPVMVAFSSTNATLQTVDLNSGVNATVGKTTATNAICVRGNRTIADRLIITNRGNNAVFGVSDTGAISRFPITIQVEDSLGNLAHVQGLVITVTANNATVGGTTSVTTVEDGTAVFSNFTLDTAGTGTLTFATATAGYTAATMSYKVGSAPNTCLVDDGVFTTATGGCKQVSTGKIWSLPTVSTTTWIQMIWDSAQAVNSADVTDAYDSSRTNDYDPATTLTGSFDTSGQNYCHTLTEGGYYDWRVPTCSELVTLYSSGTGAKNHFAWPVATMSTHYWSSTSNASACAAGLTSAASTPNGSTFNIYAGTGNTLSKTTGAAMGICVRP